MTIIMIAKHLLAHFVVGKTVDYATLTHWENQYNDRSIFPDRRRREARQLKHCIELMKSGNARAAREALKEFGNECIGHSADPTLMDIGREILSNLN